MELDSYRKRSPNAELAKRLKLLVWIVSALVLGLVAAMRPIRPWFLSLLEEPEGLSLPFLPPFHAVLNAFAAFGLVMAVRADQKTTGFSASQMDFLFLGVFIPVLDFLCLLPPYDL